MKKIILILALLMFITSCAEQVEKIEETEVFCPDYDGNQEACLLHPECEWGSDMSECDLIGTVDGDNEEEEEESEFASELEKDMPYTAYNEICKKLPLKKEFGPGDRHYCFALVNHDPRFCEFIVGDNEEDTQAKDSKTLCLAHSRQDVSYCKKMTTTLGKRTCYFRLSLLSGNIDICDGIDWDNNLRQLCYFSFVNTFYWEDKSDQITLAHCNKLPEPDRSTCLAYKDKDVSLCKNNVNCLTYFEQPMSFCTGKESVLKTCIRDRAMTSKDFSICETLTGEERDDCVGDFAGHITQDIATCDKITNIMARHTCYQDVAVQSNWRNG